MAVHVMHAPIDGTSALEMVDFDGGFSYVRGGRVPGEDGLDSSFSNDLHVAYGASGLSEFSRELRHGSCAGSGVLPSGMGACLAAGIASFAISLAFLLI